MDYGNDHNEPVNVPTSEEYYAAQNLSKSTLFV
jgi:hypothetical protein